MSGDMGSGRIAIWQQVWQLVGERPLLGGGPDTLGQRLEFFFERESGQGDIIRTKVDAAHNEYLNWLVNCGAAGLAAYLTALFATAQHVFRARHDVIALALGAAMLGYAVQAFFGISQCIVTPLFWLIWAMLECRLSEHKRVAE